MGYRLKKRGLVDVKGKGLMETYFVLSKKPKKSQSCQRRCSHSHSLEAMVFAIVENHKKFISRSNRF